MFCELCKQDIPIIENETLGKIQPYSSFAYFIFCYDCNLRVVSHRVNRKVEWKEVPIGKMPIYENAEIIGFKDKSKWGKSGVAKSVPLVGQLTNEEKDDIIRSEKSFLEKDWQKEILEMQIIEAEIMRLSGEKDK